MKLDLSEIAHTIGMQGSVDVDEQCPVDLGLDCLRPIRGRITFSNTGSLLLLDGQIETEVKLQCGRCLVDFTLPVDVPIEEEFRLVKIGDAVQALPIDEEDQTGDLVKDNLLDLQELVRQNLMVALPIQPLCRPDCQGLCPSCGENLNMGKCTCPPAEPESPFQVLAELLEEENRKRDA